jgi:hypothetical protein
MAKKVVATLKKEISAEEKIVKVIRTRRSATTGAYTFKEQFIKVIDVKSFFAK